MHTRMYVCKHICVAICACEWWKSAAIRRQIVLMPMLWHVCIILNTLWRQPARACAAHVYVCVCVCVEALKHEINAQSIANSLKDTRATKGERDKQHNTHNTQTYKYTHTHTQTIGRSWDTLICMKYWGRQPQKQKQQQRRLIKIAQK